MTQRLTPLSSNLGGFLVPLPDAIQGARWDEAVSFLCNSLGTEDCVLCYAYLLEVIPHCEASQFDQLLKHLPALLTRSLTAFQEQQALALALGEWVQRHPGSASLEDRFSSATSAMHFFAKALQIANQHSLDSISQFHTRASCLFIDLLKPLTQNFQKELDSARRGGEKEIPRFLALLKWISQLQGFCLSDEDRSLLQSLYTQASHVLSQIDPEKKERYGLSLVGQGLISWRTFPLAGVPVTQKYHEALRTFREAFKGPATAVRDLQRQTTQAFQTLFQILLDDALAILGPAPCTYDIRAMGSCGRQEVCPFSDLEFMILIQDVKFTDYFKTLVKILELQIASLGETSTDHPPFTCLGSKNPSGLHIDMSPAQNPDLIRTPQAMAQHQVSIIDHPQNIENTLLKTFSLSCSDSSLFTNYQTEVTKLLAAPTSISRISLSSFLSSPPTTTAAVAPTHSSVSGTTDTPSSPTLLSREARAIAFFKVRLDDFQDRWKKPFHSQLMTLNLKTHFVELLNHLLSDMAVFCGFSSTNTLDIIDELVTLNVFTSASGTLLKEGVSQLYKMRLRLHLLYGQQNEEAFVPGNLSTYVLTPQEYEQLEKIYHLILVPLYATLPQILTSQQLPSHLDLAHTAFTNGLIHQSLSPPLIHHFVQHLLDIQVPADLHQQYYTSLSKSSVTETLLDTYSKFIKSISSHESLISIFVTIHTVVQNLLPTNALHQQHNTSLSKSSVIENLRDTYLQVVESSPSHQSLIPILASIPTNAGLRVSSRRSQKSLETELLAITTLFPTTTPEVAVHCSSWDRPRYLTAEACEQALEPSGYLKKSYSHSAHNVCRIQGPGYDLHLKQKPSNPLMEYAIHNLTSRIAGLLTSPTQLVRFDLKGQSYPVLISQTIPGQSLKNTQDLDKKSWTWHLLCAILTRPGDGRLSNYIVHERQLYCIDNDIAFVEPVVSYTFSQQVQLAAAPFCLYPLDTPLDSAILQEFAALDVPALLDAWMDDIISQEKAYISLFPESQRKELYTEDQNNAFTPTILLREGTLATVNLQFLRLQNRISQKPTLTSGDLLQELISLQEETIGSLVFKKYQQAMNAPLEERVQQATGKYGPSMTTAQYYQACLGKVPTFEEIEKKRLFAPERARQEFFSNLLHSSSFPFLKVGLGKTSLIANFEPLKESPTRQSWILKALISQMSILNPKPRVVVLNYCIPLTGVLLDPFLHVKIEQLDLRYCSQINKYDVRKIQSQCPKLKKLFLTGCPNLIAIKSKPLFPTLEFNKLEHLDLSYCANLKSVRIKALNLKVVQGTHNPCLKQIDLRTRNLPSVDFKDSPQVELKHICLETTHSLEHGGIIENLIVLQDNSLIVVASFVGITLWDSKTMASKGMYRSSLLCPPFAVLADGTFAMGFCASYFLASESVIQILDPVNFKLKRQFKAVTGDLWHIKTLPDGTLASLAETGMIRLWDPATGLCKQTLQGHTNKVRDLAFLEDGTLVSGSDDKTIRLWDPRTGNCKQILKGHTDWIWPVTILKDGTIASGSGDNTIRLWDPTTGNCKQVLRGHTSTIRALAVLLDGTLVSGSNDDTIRLWDPVTGSCKSILEGHTSPISSLTVLADGTLVSGCMKGIIRFWR